MHYLIDTNILIYYLDDKKEAVDFIETNLENSAISSISYLEVLAFPYQTDEDRKVRDFLELFTIYDITLEIIDIAVANYQTRKIKMADNLIGATAQKYGLTLVSRNIADFKNLDLDITNPCM